MLAAIFGPVIDPILRIRVRLFAPANALCLARRAAAGTA